MADTKISALTSASSAASADIFPFVQGGVNKKIAFADLQTSLSGLTWNEITTTTTNLAVNNAYIMNNASQVVGTLPTTAAVGQKIQITGKGAGGWKVAQNSGQTIHYGTQNSTAGATGFIASQNTFDCVELVCITANTDWLVFTSQGNITVT